MGVFFAPNTNQPPAITLGCRVGGYRKRVENYGGIGIDPDPLKEASMAPLASLLAECEWRRVKAVRHPVGPGKPKDSRGRKAAGWKQHGYLSLYGGKPPNESALLPGQGSSAVFKPYVLDCRWYPEQNMQTITIYFDGGCRPTNPGNKYGSYEILLDGEQLRTEHELELGYGTNNEAEFEILLSALRWTMHSLSDFGFRPADYVLELHSDSTIVVNRLKMRNQRNKTEPEQRMSRLAMACLAYMVRFARYTADWNGREVNVARFGH